MPVSYPLVNGVRHDFSSIEIGIGGRLILGCKEITYKDSLEPGEVYGASAQKLGRTRGQQKPEASMTMYLSEWQDLLKQLGDGFGEKVFDITVNYRETGQDMITDRVIGCRVKSVDRSQSSGTDALEVKLDLDVMRIEHSDFSMIRNVRK